MEKTNIQLFDLISTITFIFQKKVQVGKDQEKAHFSTPKTEAGKNQTNNQVLIP